MRIFNIFCIILFLLSAALQYNDPDPHIWIPLYMYGALVCFYALQKRFVKWMYILGWLVYVPYAVYLFIGKNGVLSWWNEHNAENIAGSMKATKPWIEETREFFGLLLLITALIINWVVLSRKKRVNKTIRQA